MNLTWHILKKDLFRHRIAYGLWLVLLLAKIGVLGVSLSDWSVDADWFEQLQIGDIVLSVVESIVCFLLVGSFVLEDPLVGSNQFWLTRPISGRRLLAAKLLGASLLFFVVPLALGAVVWLGGGMTGEYFLAQLGFSALVQGMIVAGAFVVGTISDRSNRFLLILLGSLVAVVALSPLAQKLFTVYPESRALLQTRMAVGTMCFVVAAVGAVWLQFTRRRLAWSGTWLVVGILLGVGAWNQFPWELARGWAAEPEPVAGTEAVKLTVLHVQPSSAPSGKVPKGQRWMEIAFGVEGVPAGLHFTGGYGRLTFTARDGQRHQAERQLVPQQTDNHQAARALLHLPEYTLAKDPETLAAIAEMRRTTHERRSQRIEQDFAAGLITRQVADQRLRTSDLVEKRPAVRPRHLVARMLLPDWVVDGLRSGDVVLDTLADVRLGRVALLGEIPLHEESSVTGRGYRARIVDNLESGNGRRVILVTLRSQGRPRAEFAVFQPKIGYFSHLTPEWRKMDLPRYSAVRNSVVYQLPKLRRGDKWVDVPNADRDLRIAVFAEEPVGEVRRAVRAEQVTWGQPERE